MKKAWDEFSGNFTLALFLAIIIDITVIIIAPFQFVGKCLHKLRSKFHLKEEK